MITSQQSDGARRVCRHLHFCIAVLAADQAASWVHLGKLRQPRPRGHATTFLIEVAAERYPPADRGGAAGHEPGAPRGIAPPRWKLAALSWFGVFPVVTTMLAVAGPWLDPLPLIGRTFALTAVVVPAMGFVVMPALTRAFRSWLQR